MSTRHIQRYTSGQRAAHWAVAISFLLLLLTGLGLFDKHLAFLFSLFGGGANAILIHKYVGLAFVLFGMPFFLAHWKETSTFDEDDKAWLLMMGGYLNKKSAVPPMGRFNTGQKVFGVLTVVTALVLTATGLVLWNAAAVPPQLARVSFLLHSLCFVIMASFFVLHIYLGVIGVDGSLQAMTRGVVSEAWAKKHCPKWYAELKKSGEA